MCIPIFLLSRFRPIYYFKVSKNKVCDNATKWALILARNQMQILAEVQPGSSQNLEEMIQNFSKNSFGSSAGTAAGSDQLEEMYKKREERLKLAHADELEVRFCNEKLIFRKTINHVKECFDSLRNLKVKRRLLIF